MTGDDEEVQVVIDNLRDLADAATDGPWEIGRRFDSPLHQIALATVHNVDSKHTWFVFAEEDARIADSHSDATLIAALRNTAIPLIEHLRDDNRTMRHELDVCETADLRKQCVDQERRIADLQEALRPFARQWDHGRAADRGEFGRAFRVLNGHTQ